MPLKYCPPKAIIVNVVATASVDQETDLVALKKFNEIFHNSDVYGGRVAYFKSPRMQGKVSIFPSGKMISVGTTSEEKAISELAQTKEFLIEKQLIAKAKIFQTRIQNIVVTADFGTSIDLEELSKRNKMIYEPEQFPGAILRIEELHKATILLFASGKVVITGLRSSKYIEPTINQLASVINSQSNARL